MSHKEARTLSVHASSIEMCFWVLLGMLGCCVAREMHMQAEDRRARDRHGREMEAQRAAPPPPVVGGCGPNALPSEAVKCDRCKGLMSLRTASLSPHSTSFKCDTCFAIVPTPTRQHYAHCGHCDMDKCPACINKSAAKHATRAVAAQKTPGYMPAGMEVNESGLCEASKKDVTSRLKALAELKEKGLLDDDECATART